MEKKIVVITHVDPDSQRKMESFLKRKFQKHKLGVELEVRSLENGSKELIKGIPRVIEQVYLHYPIQEMLDPKWIEGTVKRGEQNLAIVLLNGEVVGSGSLLMGGNVYELGRTAILEKTQGLGLGKALVVARTGMALFLHKLKGGPSLIYSEPRAINVRTVHNVLKYGELFILGIAPLYDVNEEKESVLEMYRALGKEGILPIVKKERLNQALREYVDAFTYVQFEKGLPKGRGELCLIGSEVIKRNYGTIGKWYSHKGASVVKISLQEVSIPYLEQAIELAQKVAEREELGTIAIEAFATRGFEEMVRFMEREGFVVSSYVPSFDGNPGVLFTQLTQYAKPLAELYLPGEIPDEFEEVLKEVHFAHKR